MISNYRIKEDCQTYTNDFIHCALFIHYTLILHFNLYIIQSTNTHTKYVQEFECLLSKCITANINKCINEGIDGDAFRKAEILPLHKTDGGTGKSNSTLHKICENIGFYWLVFSRMKTESTILPLYGRIWFTSNPFSRIFYAAVIGSLLSFWIFHTPIKDVYMNKCILILIDYFLSINIVFVKVVAHNMPSWLWQKKRK